MSTWGLALIGGMMIGAASALLLATHGRIAGISGIVGALLPPPARDLRWRAGFLGGLAASGIVAAVIAPDAVGRAAVSLPLVAVAGLVVGYGTRLGNGCTSGHGVCGIGRLSPRSLVAVVTFMATGAATATIVGAL